MLESTPSGTSLRSIAAVAGVLLLWAAYTMLQTLFVVEAVSEGWSALIGFLPGILGVGALWAAGRSRQDCYLEI